MLNKDLFGKIPVSVERPSETPVSIRPREYIRVYHNGWQEAPPHTVKHGNADWFQERMEISPDHPSNLHGEIIHAGSPEAADERGGKYTHVYDVPKHLLNQIVYQDSDEHDQGMMPHGDGPNVEQPGLWEQTPVRPRDVFRQHKVLGYRNAFEDQGSISYMLPKRMIKDGDIKYVGTFPASDLTRKIEHARERDLKETLKALDKAP